MQVDKLLGPLSSELFLSQYWQKKPLLVRQAWPGFHSPLSADELAGLACDPAIESRIVLEKDGTHPWELRTGPFSANDFAKLPQTHWTLLVQDVDKHLPDLAYILQAFHFIPNWRLDDLMISFAPQHGSVGPHTDAYDVFLLQAQGQRHWMIDTRTPPCTELIDGTALKILQHFEHEYEWTLNPGDMLYLPPGVAHHGIALEDCITCSIGFRTPTHQSLVQSYMHSLVEHIDTDKHFTDPNLKTQLNPHELTQASIRELYQTAARYLSDDPTLLEQWAGSLLSENKDAFQPDLPVQTIVHQDFTEYWQAHGPLYRDTRLRFLFCRHDTTLHFYIDGQQIEAASTLSVDAEYLCSTVAIELHTLDKHTHKTDLLKLLCEFHKQGYYYFDGDNASTK